MPPLLVLANTNAGGVDDQTRDAVLAALRDGGTDVDTASIGPPEELAETLGRFPEHRPVAVGGDGSLHLLLAALHLRGELGERVVGLVPLGTGNDMARCLGVPQDPVEAARVVVAGRERKIDLLVDDAGEVVMNAVHLGLGAQANQDATPLKAVLGPVAYVFSALKHLNDAEMKVEVQVDDYPVLRRRARTVIVGNVGRLQGGVNLLPDAEPDNGQMDVAVLAPRNLGHWIQTAFHVLRPGRNKVPNMEVLRGSRITVTSDRPQPRQLDGDVIEESTTLDVSVRPDALWVCVYQPDTSEDLTEGS